MPKHLRSKGFTLVELMVVVAIVSVITALSVSTYAGISERTAPQNAAYDLSAAFSKARARSAERNANVWLIIWPSTGKGGVTGNGAWALYEDFDGSFKLNTVSSPEGLTSSGQNRVLQTEFLDNYPKKNVKFGVPASSSAARTGLQLDKSTAADNAAKNAILSDSDLGDGCNFCDGSGATARGAIIFTPDGEARFVNSSGAYINPAGGGRIVMVDRDAQNRAFYFGVSQPTSFVRFFSN